MTRIHCFGLTCVLFFGTLVNAKEKDADSPNLTSGSTFAEVKAEGIRRSALKDQEPQSGTAVVPEPRLDLFRDEIKPLLNKACVSCHGGDVQESDFRVDTLDPNLIHGEDVDWWLEVIDVISNGEMPPAGEAALADENRVKIVDWLSSEIQLASLVRRSESDHSSFRRMTRYEYNYALQDLLGLRYEFAQDLPPETASRDGFVNSSEVLQMSAMQFESYRELSRRALQKAIVRGSQPEPLYWSISMEAASAKLWISHDSTINKLEKQHAGDPEKLELARQKHAKSTAVRPSLAHYLNLTTRQSVKAQWRYSGARYAMSPTKTRSEIPKQSDHVAVLPARQSLVVELGDQVHDAGTLRVRVRAWRTSVDDERVPELRLSFGHQASNNSSAEVVVSDRDQPILATSQSPQFYQWDIPLSEITRNPMRKIAKMGATPNPSEYLKLHNASSSPMPIQIDHVEVISPAYDQWPPASHRRVLIDNIRREDEAGYARLVLANFMPKAWRRPVKDSEINRKLKLFNHVRAGCADFEEAIVEVLATVLSSPHFLYLSRGSRIADDRDGSLDLNQLATRLSSFLWCSLPDEELLRAAADGTLAQPPVLIAQTSRMLADPKSDRFSHHFVRGWLGMELLDFLQVDKKAYPRFDSELKAAMQTEPTALFQEILRDNGSVLDFLHCDYVVVNERLARHYGISGVYGSGFQRVKLNSNIPRGGVLTQAGLLAMNSDGKDSHPLKRGIWLLESLLNDPPPPPPPAVPEIDLADPEIAKMALKERIEDHRNHPACLSCHSKIDPWGIAFENFDAIGSYRTQIKGQTVDATSHLFNQQELAGIDGLKRFLLANRQDQFVRALTHKLTTFALGRPLTFGDRSEVERIASELRREGDGLADLIRLVVTSQLFTDGSTFKGID